MVTRFFSFLVFCLMLVACGNVYGADATCVRAWTFYPANGRGVADKSNGPVVIRVEVQGAYAPARERANTEFAATVSAWQSKTGKNKAVVPLLRVLSVGAPTYSDVQSFCWTHDHRFATQYRAIVDSWPRATFPANPRAGLAKQIAPTIPVVAIEYVWDTARAMRVWRKAPNAPLTSLYTVTLTIEYREYVPDSSGGTDLSTQQWTDTIEHVYASSEEGAYSQVRTSFVDKITAKEASAGRTWRLVDDSKNKSVTKE